MESLGADLKQLELEREAQANKGTQMNSCYFHFCLFIFASAALVD